MEGPTSINYMPGERALHYSKATFLGKDSLIDMSLDRSGDLILTNHRLVFKGGVVLGSGFEKEISIPLDTITSVTSDRRILKGGAHKLLNVSWKKGMGKKSIVLLPSGEETYTDSIITGFKRAATLDFEGVTDLWVRKILEERERFFQLENSASAEETSPPPQSSVDAAPKRFCSTCGTKADDGKFCGGCGAQL